MGWGFCLHWSAFNLFGRSGSLLINKLNKNNNNKGFSLVKTWNTKQQQAFEEVLNIGLGRAAVTLSKVVKQETMLATSGIHVSNINTGQALDLVKRNGADNWVSVSQTIGGDFDAVSLLVFSNEDAFKMMHAILNDAQMADFARDYDPDVMSEIASIILNACMSAMINMLGLSLESYQPVHHFGDCESVMLDTPVLPIKVLIDLEMIIAGAKMNGFITLSLTTKSLQQMVQFLNQYLDSEAFEWVM